MGNPYSFPDDVTKSGTEGDRQMAYRYWDYPTSTTTYWDTSVTGNGSTTTTATNWNSTNSGLAGTGRPLYYYVTRVVVTHYLVDAPEHWTEADRADFTYLINDATNTGFKLKFWFNGDVDICDPNVHRRSMQDILPLLLSHANGDDKAIIRDFFEKHPLTPPTEAA